MTQTQTQTANGDGNGDGEQVDKPQIVHVSEQIHDEYIGRGPSDEANVADAHNSHLNNTDIGARGWLGNPFMLSENTQRGVESRSESIKKYAEALQARLDGDPSFKHALISLEGKRLGCWCRRSDESKPVCHGDVIASTVVDLLETGESSVGTWDIEEDDGQ